MRVSEIATYDSGNNYWILNDDTVITPLQYLSIYINEYLHIPYYRTFINNGQIDVNGFLHLENDLVNFLKDSSKGYLQLAHINNKTAKSM
jgi:hypothetical protein